MYNIAQFCAKFLQGLDLACHFSLVIIISLLLSTLAIMHHNVVQDPICMYVRMYHIMHACTYIAMHVVIL